MAPLDREELLRKLRATFVVELAEHTQAFNRDLLALEQGPPSEAQAQLLATLFRTAHSLKGAARSVNVELIEAACHRLEGLIADLRDDALLPQPALFQVLFMTVDGIEDVGVRLREQRELSGAPLEQMLPRLEAARRLGSSALPAQSEPARPGPAAKATVQDKPTKDQGAVVRISAAKLDALLATSSELLVARRRLEPRVEELGGLIQFVNRWREDWRRVAHPLRAALVQRGPEPQNETPPPALSAKLVRALEQVGENLDRSAGVIETLLSSLVADRRALERAAAPLEQEVRRARMGPFAEVCEGLERVARDIATASGKDVSVTVEGGEIELDRAVLEELKDPLRHLVRNAVDHGIEAPPLREARGKNRRGLVRVGAALHGERVRITVTDDGSGLDLAAVAEAAARRKLATPSGAQDAAQLILLPGFSTTRFITEVSGRGVGLDVVRNKVEALHGSLAVGTEPGLGLSVTLEVPLTLSTIRAVLLSVAGQVHAIAETHVQGLVRIGAEDVRSVEGREVLVLGSCPMPLVSLAEILGVEVGEAPRLGAKIPVVCLCVGEQRVAFSVDEILAEHDLVVTNLGPRLRRLVHYSGATLRPDGRVALILNAPNLVRSALRHASRMPIAQGLAAPLSKPKRLLVVDDSVTTRSLVKSILEAAGYLVMTAPDGAAAWQVLQERGADLIVSDVEMPRMDGCALVATIRQSARFRALPVVLVTALSSAEDRARGLESGADAYLVKSAFDQRQLLETISQLV